MSATSRKMVAKLADAISTHLDQSKGVNMNVKSLFLALRQNDRCGIVGIRKNLKLKVLKNDMFLMGCLWVKWFMIC